MLGRCSQYYSDGLWLAETADHHGSPSFFFFGVIVHDAQGSQIGVH